MTVMRFFRPAVLMAALAISTPVFAQNVTTTDIQRLQDQVYDAGNEVSRLRSRDQNLADRLQTQLDDARDEVIYLKVKMRKEGSVSRNDYSDVRSRIESLRAEARTDAARQGSGNWSSGSGSGTSPNSGYGSGSASGSGSNSGYGTGSSTGGSGNEPQSRPATQSRRNEIPSGQEVDVRIEREVSSATAQVEDRF